MNGWRFESETFSKLFEILIEKQNYLEHKNELLCFSNA